jgi:hypothetical protein
MRSSLVVGSLFIAASAAADPTVVVGPSDTQPIVGVQIYQPPAATSGMWIDFGGGVERVALGNGGLYNDHFVRFAPQVTINRHFYLGAEIDVGSFNGTEPDHGGTTTRPSDMATVPHPIDGTSCEGKVIAGARAISGIVSGGVELTAGMRYLTSSRLLLTNMVENNQGLVEARGRLDLWVTPNISVGGIVGIDVTEKDDVTAALQVGFHFARYDHSR